MIEETERTRLPYRRTSLRHQIKYMNSSGDQVAEVSFGFDRQGIIREVFCLAAKDGSDMQAIVHDACIAMSHALQRGARIADLAKSFGEQRAEGASSGPPASVMGALAREGEKVELELVGHE